ncbi:hypothetical protein BDM02DRAFT_3189300 [Thelephora ganbajun]|uniref:Uncharacterized protein n=1 Tax=Thelephora ganbajun TaxID=370292 RepID=A0ACB6Z8P1_THEGA|nr:hypothetical protein BDM02DRAFT_3189300 [Thelephora ganbajun]
MTTSTFTLLDFLKPRRNEAALRLRNSLLALAVLFVITNLSSALPSISSSLTVVWNAVTPEPTPSKSRSGSVSDKSESGMEGGVLWWTISLIEGGVCALLMMSIFQSAFALKYPRGSFPPMATPVKPFNTPANSPAASQSKHKILSPTKVTPQKQKPFNPASSTLSTSTYLTSPVSTPSRTLNYKLPAASPFNDSKNSNVSMSTSVPPSPSPLLSSPLMAYRGKHSQSTGRPLTSSFLEKLTADDDDDD